MSGEAQTALDQGRLPRSELSREKVQQLLAAVGTRPAREDGDLEVAEYNWHQPHRFNGAELETLEGLAKAMAEATAKKFGALSHQQVNVKPNSITEHFSDELVDKAKAEGDNDFYLAFVNEQEKQLGFVWIPFQTGLAWVRQLLGDSQTQADASRELSELEQSLLCDLSIVIIQAVSESFQNLRLEPVGGLLKGRIPIDKQQTQQLCRITFDFQISGAEEADSQAQNRQASVVILSDELEGFVGKDRRKAAVLTGEAATQAIVEHLKKLSVCVTARLAQTSLTFGQIMDIDVGDVVVLGKKIDEPVDILLDGRTILKARPISSAGKYAVLITECGPG